MCRLLLYIVFQALKTLSTEAKVLVRLRESCRDTKINQILCFFFILLIWMSWNMLLQCIWIMLYGKILLLPRKGRVKAISISKVYFLESLHWTCAHSKHWLRFLYSWIEVYEFRNNTCLETFGGHLIQCPTQKVTLLRALFSEETNISKNGDGDFTASLSSLLVFDYNEAVWVFSWYLI